MVLRYDVAVAKRIQSRRNAFATQLSPAGLCALRNEGSQRASDVPSVPGFHLGWLGVAALPEGPWSPGAGAG